MKVLLAYTVLGLVVGFVAGVLGIEPAHLLAWFAFSFIAQREIEELL